LKRRAYSWLIAAILVTALVLTSCGGGNPGTTTSSSVPLTTTSSAPPTTSSLSTKTSIPPTTSSATTTATSSVPPTTTSSTPPTTTASGVRLVKVEWGTPPKMKTHPALGFENCLLCHIQGGVGALVQVTPSHACDECHKPGPELTYNCTGGSPDPLPSCTMCHV